MLLSIVPDSTWLLRLEICLCASYTKDIGTVHSGPHKRCGYVIFSYGWVLCERGEVAVSLGLYNCRSPPLPSPLWIWRWFLILSFCFFLCAGPPPWLGEFREYLLLFWVCLCTLTDGNSGTLHVKHQADLITRGDFTGSDCLFPVAGFIICIYYVFEQGKGCLVGGGDQIINTSVHLLTRSHFCGCLLRINRLTSSFWILTQRHVEKPRLL